MARSSAARKVLRDLDKELAAASAQRDQTLVWSAQERAIFGPAFVADVDAALKDTARLSSAKGDILEVVLTDPVIPYGIFINEDPPLHTIHRAIVSGHSPRKR